MRTCGNCRLCCKVFALNFMKKPAHLWCKHATKHGCAIHDQPRHPDWENYQCFWLQSERLMPDDSRPDRCGLIFTYRSSDKYDILQVSQSYNDAWLNNRLGNRLVRLLACGPWILAVFWNGEIRLE